MAVKRGICMSKNKLSSLEKKWILYDVGNSAFILLVTTIMPIYFNHLCSVAGLSEDQYLSTWSYAASLATICVALAGPIMGAVSDFKGNKKKVFLFNALLGSLLLFCCCSAAVLLLDPQTLGYLHCSVCPGQGSVFRFSGHLRFHARRCHHT